MRAASWTRLALSLCASLAMSAPVTERSEGVVEERDGAPRRAAPIRAPGDTAHAAWARSRTDARNRRLMEVTSTPLTHALPELDDGGLGKAKPAVPASKRWDVCVVGAGLSGGIVAERLASLLDKSVLVVEKRRHIAGNCYDYAEEETGLRINLYGPHNFHTNSEDAWQYINKFGRWNHYYHKKLSWSEDLGRCLPRPSFAAQTSHPVCWPVLGRAPV